MSNNKTSLFVSNDGMTDPLGQSQVLPYLCGLSKNGYTIFLLSCEKEEAFKNGKNIIQKICDENNITWYPIKYYNKPPIVATFFNLIRLNNLAKKLVAKHNIQLLHCRSYFCALIGLGFKQKHGKKFLFDMRGFYANERVDGNIWPQSSFIYRKIFEYFKSKEIEFCENADYTISLTHNGKDEIHSWQKVKNNPIPIQIIPCCADLDFFSRKHVNAAEVTRLKKQLNITENDYVISYLGAIGTWYLTDEMLAFFRCLEQKKNNAVFLIITAENPDIVYASAQKQGINKNNIRVIKASRNEVVQLLSFCNFSIFFIMPAYSKKASSPTKLGELLSMGIPVICNGNVGDVEQIINSSETGIVINKFDDETYYETIAKMDDFASIDIAKRAEKVKDFFDLKSGIEKYTSVYKKILGE